jgi:glycosyltransferase involved in cell wall biosynthesis
LNYHNVKRVAGKSNWTVWQLFKYAMDGIFDFSQAPLNFTLWLGLTSSLLSFIGIIFIIVRHWIFPQYAVQGWSSLVCIILLIGGLQLLCIGLVGRYVGRIYLQVKDRPIYIIKEKK